MCQKTTSLTIAFISKTSEIAICNMLSQLKSIQIVQMHITS